MKLEVITPEKKIFEGEIESIKVPGAKGSFAVLNNHAPIISTLVKGDIKVLTSAFDVEVFSITGGVIEVHQNEIVVLADME